MNLLCSENCYNELIGFIWAGPAVVSFLPAQATAVLFAKWRSWDKRFRMYTQIRNWAIVTTHGFRYTGKRTGYVFVIIGAKLPNLIVQISLSCGRKTLGNNNPWKL